MIDYQLYPSTEPCLMVAHIPHGQTLQDCFFAEQEQIAAHLQRYGAILFRHSGIQNYEQFAQLAQGLFTKLLDYRYRSTPRTDLGERVYTATEYPARLTIAQHNENAYQADWPMRLLFCCLQPAEQGGETPLTPIRAVTRALPNEIITLFQQRQLSYVRHYHRGVDIPWQTVFQCDTPSQVAAYCDQHQIEHHWDDTGVLCTRQQRPALARHPCGETLWFNQAHLFHQSALEPATFCALMGIYGEQALPRNVYFGDGELIDEKLLLQIRAAYAQHTLKFTWQAQDVLLLDNMLVAHGRAPYRGGRQVLVAMGQPYSSSL